MGVSLVSILDYGNSQSRYVQSRTLESIGHDVLAAPSEGSFELERDESPTSKVQRM